MKKQNGFTLLELIIVIVILGVLAVIAIPRYFDFSIAKEIAATKLIADSLSSANSANYSIRKANVKKGVPIINCKDVAKALSTELPKGYVITSTLVKVNATVTCTLTEEKGQTATFTATGIK